MINRIDIDKIDIDVLVAPKSDINVGVELYIEPKTDVDVEIEVSIDEDENVELKPDLNVDLEVIIDKAVNVECETTIVTTVMALYSGKLPYQGTYEVTPQIQKQELLTKDKYLEDNILIKPIPYYEVENTQKGKTIIIG